MQNSKYTHYLLTAVWQKRRLEILSRDKWTCKNCGDNNDKIQKHVHHLKYSKIINETPDSELICLCDPCHRILHSKNGAYKLPSNKIWGNSSFEAMQKMLYHVLQTDGINSALKELEYYKNVNGKNEFTAFADEYLNDY